ncbi:hypothetical protein CCP4SC76_4750003 [Gammaproteobacteria bacterium]
MMKHDENEAKEPTSQELAMKFFLYTFAGVILYGLAVLIYVR